MFVRTDVWMGLGLFVDLLALLDVLEVGGLAKGRALHAVVLVAIYFGDVAFDQVVLFENELSDGKQLELGEQDTWDLLHAVDSHGAKVLLIGLHLVYDIVHELNCIRTLLQTCAWVRGQG